MTSPLLQSLNFAAITWVADGPLPMCSSFSISPDPPASSHDHQSQPSHEMAVWWMLGGSHPFHHPRKTDGDRGHQVGWFPPGDKAVNTKINQRNVEIKKWLGTSHSFTFDALRWYFISSILITSVYASASGCTKSSLTSWSGCGSSRSHCHKDSTSSELLPSTSQCDHITLSSGIEPSWLGWAWAWAWIQFFNIPVVQPHMLENRWGHFFLMLA